MIIIVSIWTVLITTEKLFRSFNSNSRNKFRSTEIKQMKQSLPIQSVADLAVDGKDLMEWTGLKGGRWKANGWRKLKRPSYTEHVKMIQTT